MELKQKKLEPVFEGKVRSGGNVTIVTIPEWIQENFPDVKQGGKYRFRIEEVIEEPKYQNKSIPEYKCLYLTNHFNPLELEVVGYEKV